ncbi:E3 SUMO-protein ligase ZBED1-like [Polypterus senegalus]|uniref:E3 SUMO-protein ligase ZBED1-like n=1 Tax=Polypterus senegalus TaxID=55291 RepID=UPI0019653CE3|nr:E3 SUMO-protein ligase ZBED1-like [Polypterus senegalus]
MIATDFQPFSIVEDTGFKKYSQALNPSYIPPSRKALAQKVTDMYDRETASLKRRVSKVPAVCLTTDCWTSRTTASYMSVTCHFIEDFRVASCLLDCFEFSERHTADNIAQQLLSVAAEWGVDKKVVCCLTDNAANVTKAIQTIGWTHLPCLAHTINLVVRDNLQASKPIIDKVKEAVEYFHRSTVGAQKLKETQLQMKMEELRPKQDCPTRWNSTYYMLKSFIASKNAIISTLAVTNAPVRHLSQEEWTTVQEICTILQPFEEVTVELSAESYLTASKVAAQGVIDSLCASMSLRFHRIHANHILADTAALDPRFRRMAFPDGRTADETFQRLSTAAARISSDTPIQQQPAVEGLEGAGSGAGSIVWSYFHEKVAGTVEARNPTSDAVMEVRAYLEEPLLPTHEDPLKWWECRAPVYPRLSKLMAKKLCVVATSVPSERIFSKTGQIISERRSRLKPKWSELLSSLMQICPRTRKRQKKP